jgi:predicted ester cyclase
MSAKEIKALMRRAFEVINKGKAASITTDEIWAPNFVLHTGTGRDIRGLKDYKQWWSENYNAFPDLHFTLDDMVVEGDKVVSRYTMTGTHKGEIMGIPPTNKKVTNWMIEIDHVAGGKLMEGWVRWDTLGLMQQLGVIPTPKKEK